MNVLLRKKIENLLKTSLYGKEEEKAPMMNNHNITEKQNNHNKEKNLNLDALNFQLC